MPKSKSTSQPHLVSTALTQEDIKRLCAVINERRCRLLVYDELEFLRESGCPPEQFERWLQSCWIQYDIPAVLTGSATVGWQPVLLLRQAPMTGRLFCPTEELLRATAVCDAQRALQQHMAARPWEDCAEEIITQLDQITAACTAGRIPLVEIQVLVCAINIAIEALVHHPGKPNRDYWLRLYKSGVTFWRAFSQAHAHPSAQEQYGELRVEARRAAGKNHKPVLDPYPALRDFILEVCSRHLASYMEDEVQIGPEQFLDMLQMLAHDRAEATSIANPPARVRYALQRKAQRQRRLDRQRWIPASAQEMSGLCADEDPETRAIVQLDWENAKRELVLPADQAQLIEAQFDGLNPQACEAADQLGWDAPRLGRVRRSLAADRRWGQELRKRLRVYSSAGGTSGRKQRRLRKPAK